MNVSHTGNKLIRLQIRGWRQFESVDVEFHERLTIITGANGAGKSTLLNAISPLLGWDVSFAATPIFRTLLFVSSSVVKYATSAWRSVVRRVSSTSDDPNSQAFIGRITVALDIGTRESIELSVPRQSTTRSYAIEATPKCELAGIFVPSHRPIYALTNVDVPRDRYTYFEAYDRYAQAVRSAWSNKRERKASPLQVLKTSLLSWKRKEINRDDLQILAFNEILRQLLPHSMSFRDLVVEHNEVVLKTGTGDFTLDAVSGGVAAVIDIAWQLFTYAKANGGRPFVAVIDEPENHLHPEMQRTLVPRLLDAFPEVQLIVASHAPLIVTSVQDCNVYALMYKERPPSVTSVEPGEEMIVDESQASFEASNLSTSLSPDTDVSVARRQANDHDLSVNALVDSPITATVVALKLDMHDRSGTANDILCNVLGLDYTMPIWASKALDEAVTTVAEANYSLEAIDRLDLDLTSRGVGQYGVETLRRLNDRSELKSEPRQR